MKTMYTPGSDKPYPVKRTGLLPKVISLKNKAILLSYIPALFVGIACLCLFLPVKTGESFVFYSQSAKAIIVACILLAGISLFSVCMDLVIVN